MHLRRMSKRVVLAAVCMSAAMAHAATIWDEDVSGDLSDNGSAPTPLVMGIGSNQVLGATGNDGGGIDLDHFTFTVPSGAALTSLILLGNTTVSGGASFLGISAAPTISVGNLLSFLHYSGDQIGTDLLETLGTGALPSGTYSVWVQETGGPVTYGFDFVTVGASAQVPTLPEWGVILLGTLLAGVTLRQAGPSARWRL